MVRLLCLLALAGCEGVIDGGEDMGSPECVSPDELDCQLACMRLDAIAPCLGKAKPPFADVAACLTTCAEAKVMSSNRAAVLGCFQTFLGDCNGFFACARDCQTVAGGPCDPALRGPCLETEVCDAATRTCVAPPRCESDRNCADGYACTPLGSEKACYRNCSDGRGLPIDSLCQPTHGCDETTFACVPWPCVTSAAGLDCKKGCGSLAQACQSPISCNPVSCQTLATCESRCEQIKAAATDKVEIAVSGCLQLAHTCEAYGACESICVPAPSDAGAGD